MLGNKIAKALVSGVLLCSLVGVPYIRAAAATTAPTVETNKIVYLTQQNYSMRTKYTKLRAQYKREKDVYHKLNVKYHQLDAKYHKLLNQKHSDSRHWQTLSQKVHWTKEDVRWAVAYQCKKQHISNVSWLQDAAVDIIFIGAAESHGDTHCGYGQYQGIFQFGNAWGSREKRRSGTWSVKRFVKVYKKGGSSAIHQHWLATLNR